MPRPQRRPRPDREKASRASAFRPDPEIESILLFEKRLRDLQHLRNQRGALHRNRLCMSHCSEGEENEETNSDGHDDSGMAAQQSRRTRFAQRVQHPPFRRIEWTLVK